MSAVSSGDAPPVDVTAVRRIERPEATRLAETELLRYADALEALTEPEWALPTANDGWDVRAMAGHSLGMAETFTGLRRIAVDMWAGQRLRGDGPHIDGLTAQQVRRSAGLSHAELIARMRAVAPVGARWRSSRRLLRRAPMTQEVPGNGGPERWSMGLLFDVILTRDPWTHRSDLALATGRPMRLDAAHDGRIVADAVADWAARHGQPFTLELTGPAGGSFVQGVGGERLSYDAVEFCRILSGRPAATTGLLAVQVPF